MNDTPAVPVLQTEPFTISKITLLPEDVVGCPLGDVLHVGFAGSTAFAWIKHHPGEEGVMNLVTLPTGGPFTLETAQGFKQPHHVGSFQKTAGIQVHKGIEQMSAQAWHVFAWHPVAGSATYNSLPSLALN